MIAKMKPVKGKLKNTPGEKETPEAKVGDPLKNSIYNSTLSLTGMGLLFDTHPT